MKMLEELISEITANGMTIRLDASFNGTRGVRYNATIKNKTHWDRFLEAPSIEFEVGAWDVPTLKAKIDEKMILVDSVIKFTNDERRARSVRVEPNMDPKTALERPVIIVE
jgi:Fe-S cluster assembly iron-binding protein IscA